MKYYLFFNSGIGIISLPDEDVLSIREVNRGEEVDYRKSNYTIDSRDTFYYAQDLVIVEGSEIKEFNKTTDPKFKKFINE